MAKLYKVSKIELEPKRQQKTMSLREVSVSERRSNPEFDANSHGIDTSLFITLTKLNNTESNKVFDRLFPSCSIHLL